MPAFTTTTELFSKTAIERAAVEVERQLRLVAGAIRSDIDEQADPLNFVLTTHWKLLGPIESQTPQPLSSVSALPAAPAAAVSAASTDQSAPLASNSVIGDFHGNGASANTASQDHLPPGVDASRAMAKTDFDRVTPLKDRFNIAAAVTGLPPALLAAVASRESRCGNILARDGTGDFGNAFGIMQVDRRFHTIAGQPDPRSQAHINQASGILKDYLTAMVTKLPKAAPARQLQAAVAAYNCGSGSVASPDTADAATTGHDYSNDVWERARFYAAGW
jgi:hypothetical protein